MFTGLEKKHTTQSASAAGCLQLLDASVAGCTYLSAELSTRDALLAPVHLVSSGTQASLADGEKILASPLRNSVYFLNSKCPKLKGMM